MTTYLVNCDTYCETFDSPGDFQWSNCGHSTYNTQQTVAIYVH